MGQITNTTEQAKQNGMPFHLQAQVMGNAGMIEQQESAGQAEMVNSTQLPTSISGDRTTLEAEGVVFGEVVKGDPLFQEATLPEGWQKVATDHSMWSELRDAEGVVRARIFYKAAFYDRDAFMNIK